MSDVSSPLTFVQPPSAPDTFNVLLYGKPKSGKSTAAATAPGPILWVNAEGGGALGFARKVAAERGNEIHEVAIDPKGINAAAVLDGVYLHVRDKHEPQIRTVVVDTVAKVRDALVAQFVVKGSKQSLPQYGQVADKLGGFILALRDLPVNLILLAHVDQKDSEDGRTVDPLIGGQLTEKVPGEVDVVAYTSMHEETTEDGVHRRYYGQLVESKGRQAGDRSGALAGDRGFRELDLSEWLRVYRAALTPSSPDDSDLPFSLAEGPVAPIADDSEDGSADPDSPGGQFDLGDAIGEAA